jgi:hypothetical protein
VNRSGVHPALARPGRIAALHCLERDGDIATAAELVEALAYRAELALRAEDPATAGEAIARARALTLSAAERDGFTETLAGLDDLEAVLRTASRP